MVIKVESVLVRDSHITRAYHDLLCQIGPVLFVSVSVCNCASLN